MPPDETRGGVAEASPEEHPGSFDPEVGNGDAEERDVQERRRSHKLDPEIGAAPFDPGDGFYDGRRAKREAKRREKAEREQREREQEQVRAERERAAAERKREQTAREQREREERERRARAEQKRAEQERAEREAELERQRSQRQRAQRQRAKRAHDERERLREQERVERDQAERERREEKRRKRDERDREIAAERERKEQERAERARQDRAARERRERRRRQRSQARRPRRAKPAAQKRAPAKLRTAPAGPRRRTPKPRRAATAPQPRPTHTSLKKPSAKLGGTVAAIAAAAIGLGALLGLPVPLLNDDSVTTPTSLASQGSLAGIDPGTPKGLTKGPYFPVVLDAPADFGEAAAKFGASRSGHKHEGQDLFAKPGTPLVAVRDGVVLDGAGGRNFYSTGGGNTLVIYSAIDNRSYVYLHMLKPALVKNGDEVRAGQLVGQVGCTGSCDGPHLHFEVRNGRAYWGAKAKAIDPLPLIRQWPQRPTD